MNFKKLVTIVIILYINFALYMAGYIYLNMTIIDDFELAEGNTYSLKEHFKRAWNKRVNSDTYELQQREIVERLKRLMKNLPDSLNKEQLKESVVNRKDDLKLEIKDFSYQTVTSFEFYSIHEINMQLIGHYKDITKFMHDLETGSGIIVAASEFSMSAIEGDKVQLIGIFHGYHYHAEPDTKEIYEKWAREYKDYDQAL